MANFAGNNPANDPDSKPVKGRSMFKPNRSFYQTVQFGLNSPHFAFDALEGDKLSVRIGSDVDTYSLKAPLMTPVKMQKDYFFVPLRSIIPLGAEKLITNPLTGDDVVAENVNCVVDTYWLGFYVQQAASSVVAGDLTAASAAASVGDADAYLLRALCNYVSRVEPFASYGSLLTHLGHSVGKMNRWAIQKDGTRLYGDDFFEVLVDRLIEDVESFKVHFSDLDGYGNTYPPVSVSMTRSDEGMSSQVWNFNRFLEELRQGRQVHDLYDITLKSTVDVNRRGLDRIDSDGTVVSGASAWSPIKTYGSNSADTRYLNFSRCVASAAFYTEDSVDYVYSAQLWHENQQSLVMKVLGDPGSYLLNGIRTRYDEVSGYTFFRLLQYFSVDLAAGSYYPPSSGAISVMTTDSTTPPSVTGYIYNLFGFTRSLKFRDYFCGSKTRPMAVGNVDVQVSGGQFSVVDVTKNIQIQRFLNQVNRVGRKFKEYVSGIFGTTPMHDPCEPVFLGMTRDVIGAEETENTGAAQLVDPQTTTSKLRKSSSQFAFEGSFAEPGVVVGITHFDVVRPYVDSSDRSFFHVDRFDMFNPFMQTIGDQEVYGMEIDTSLDNIFGYQLRYAEYKQSFDHCAGAFARFLPGYAFLNRNSNLEGFGVGNLRISPDFIRSRPCEFDRFYISLTHHSLAGYFHFIIRHDINIDASRAMDAAPSIL